MVLVIGATGFVGRFLVTRLLKAGNSVRVTARHIGQADAILGHNKDIEIVRGDALEAGSIIRAMAGKDTVIFLATSIGNAYIDRSPEELDKRMMTNLIRAASIPNPPRIIFLSVLCDPDRQKTAYIESKFEMEKELRKSGLPHCIFRAPVIIGKWGLFFRLCKALIERSRLIFLPRSASTPCQPIYVGDVASYLVQAVANKDMCENAYEIPGHDVMTYFDMIDLFSKTLGYSKGFLVVPVNFSNVAARILTRATGISHNAVKASLEAMSIPMVASDETRTYRDFPEIHPLGYLDAILKALREN